MITGFAALNAEVDKEALSLRPHLWKGWAMWTGRRWLWVFACEGCGLKYEGFRENQICVGVLGELMLAHEKIPARWRHNFNERMRLGRRAWKPKQQQKHNAKN